MTRKERRQRETALRRERGDLLVEIVRRLAAIRGVPKNRIHQGLALVVDEMVRARIDALAKKHPAPPLPSPELEPLLMRYIDLSVDILELEAGQSVQA